MSWAGLFNNQAISCNNLQNAVNTNVFTAKTTIPATDKCITKTEANTYVNIWTGYPSYASKASNQLVVKQDLVALALTEVRINDTISINSTTYCSTNVCGNSGNYTYIQRRIDAILWDQAGNPFNNNTGNYIYVDLNGIVTGCYSGTVPFSIAIPNGSSSSFIYYDAQITDNCGDPDIFCCTTTETTIECVSGITNSYPIAAGSAYFYCSTTFPP